MVGVAEACKMNPSVADNGGEFAWFRATTCQVFVAIGIVKAKGQIAGMNRSRPAVQGWCFPCEPVKISWCALGGFAFRLDHCSLPDLCRHGQRKDVKRFRPRMRGSERFNDRLRIDTIHISKTGLYFRFGHLFTFRMI